MLPKLRETSLMIKKKKSKSIFILILRNDIFLKNHFLYLSSNTLDTHEFFQTERGGGRWTSSYKFHISFCQLYSFFSSFQREMNTTGFNLCVQIFCFSSFHIFFYYDKYNFTFMQTDKTLGYRHAARFTLIQHKKSNK